MKGARSTGKKSRRSGSGLMNPGHPPTKFKFLPTVAERVNWQETYGLKLKKISHNGRPAR